MPANRSPRDAPILIVNPVTDGVFSARARGLAAAGGTALDVQIALRAYYPNAVVRDRDLTGEATTWYVYRDGRWTPT